MDNLVSEKPSWIHFCPIFALFSQVHIVSIIYTVRILTGSGEIHHETKLQSYPQSGAGLPRWVGLSGCHGGAVCALAPSVGSFIGERLGLFLTLRQDWKQVHPFFQPGLTHNHCCPRGRRVPRTQRQVRRRGRNQRARGGVSGGTLRAGLQSAANRGPRAPAPP